MSEQAAEGGAVPELPPPSGDRAFADLMDTLVGDEDGTSSSQAGGEAAAGAGGGDAPAGGTDRGGDAPAGRPTAGDQPTPADAGAAAGADGAAGAAAPGGDGAADGGAGQPAAGTGAGDRPDAWTASSADLIPKLGQLSTALEENTAKAYQKTALEEVKTEHAKYFEALEKHPRLLVGMQVPAIGKDGNELLRDTNDAREWQDAAKHILAEEVRDRASRAMEESGDFLQTVHQSIELFQNNPDLVPGTKDFDVDLANRFATMATPYEIRVDGKLQGYSIPVQPIIEHLRNQVAAARSTQSAPAGDSTPSAGAPRTTPTPPADPPQAGVQSKAGNSGEVEDFSTLFGTIGLPNLQI